MPSYRIHGQTRPWSVNWLPTLKIFCEGDISLDRLIGGLTRFSHIGHSPETNFTQLADLVKRRRTCFLSDFAVIHEYICSSSTFTQWSRCIQIYQSGYAFAWPSRCIISAIMLSYDNKMSFSQFFPESEKRSSFSSHFLHSILVKNRRSRCPPLYILNVRQLILCCHNLPHAEKGDHQMLTS